MVSRCATLLPHPLPHCLILLSPPLFLRSPVLPLLHNSHCIIFRYLSSLHHSEAAVALAALLRPLTVRVVGPESGSSGIR